MTYKPMTDKEHAAFLQSLAARLRDSVGDHLKLLKIAAELDEDASDIIDPPPLNKELTQEEAEAESRRAAIAARGLPPEPVPPVAPAPSGLESENPKQPATKTGLGKSST